MTWRHFLVGIILGFLGGVAVASIGDALGVDHPCPTGHSVAADREGPYYVYTPNLPAGYSAVWVNNDVTLFPPPGTYGQPGDRVIVCYTNDIAAFAEQLAWEGPSGQVAKPEPPPQGETRPCIDDNGDEGILTPDGVCWTRTLYDETFSEENLAQVESQTSPGRSVADVISELPLGAASDRPRIFAGIELPSFARIIQLAHGQVVAL